VQNKVVQSVPLRLRSGRDTARAIRGRTDPSFCIRFHLLRRGRLEGRVGFCDVKTDVLCNPPAGL